MGMFINVDDLLLFNSDQSEELIEAMIDDAESMALAHVPELADITDAVKKKTVKAVLRQALNRWIEAGSGAVVTEAAGPFSHTLDTRATRKGMFYKGEIEQLAVIAGRKKSGGKAFSIDTGRANRHTVTCSVYFGGACSCGLSDLGAVLYP
jgi:hypothetical protein